MELLNTVVNIFGLAIEELWLAIASIVLGAILLTIVIIICACGSKKKKAEKAAAQKAAEEKAAQEAEEAQRAEEEAEAARKAAEKKKAEEEAKKAEEEAARVAAEEEAKKAEEEKAAAEAAEAKKAEEAAAKKQAAAEKRKQTLAAKKAAEEAAKKEAEEKAAQEAEEAKKAEEEAARVAAEEEAKKAAEEAKKAEEAEAKKKAAAEKRKQTLAAKKAAEEAAKKEAEEKAAQEEVKEEAPVAVAEVAPAQEAPAEEVKEEKPVAKKAEEKPVAKAPRYSGKWVISKVTVENEEGEHYLFDLFASNGQLLLTSWEYNSQQGALRGMETYKANIEKGNFRIYETKKGEFFFKLLTAKNTLLGTGANYPTKELCEKAVESVKRFAATAVLDEKVREVVLKANEEDDFTETVEKVAEDYVGKWIISVDKKEDGKETYTFELFANNGQLLLSSEEYTSYVGVINGIATHKASIQKGNFSIQLTKKKEYFFLLLNGNNQPLCLGEHYKSKARCESAVESVKRFALNAPIFFDGKEVK